MASLLSDPTDIVVAGGGPAGATVSRLLAGLGFRVVLLEKARFPRYQIGESLPPSILSLLDFLGLRQCVEGAGFLRMPGHTALWGSPHPRTSYYSEDHTRLGFQVWREEFDRLLLEEARKGGVWVQEGVAVERVEWEGGVRVFFRGLSDLRGEVRASFFVDATGRSGILARQGLRQRDGAFQTLALTAYWQGALGPEGRDFANTLVEAYPDGLVWSVPLHNGLRNVTLLVDWQEGAKIRREGLGRFYTAELKKAPYVLALLEHARVVCPPKALDASLYTARSFGGKGFLLVGDAGFFLDPLSSEGVHKAMASATTAAVVVNTILKRPSMAQHALRFYEEGQRASYLSHYYEAARYYREEGRWPDRPFWRKRSQAAKQDPTPPGSRPAPPLERFRPLSSLRLAPGVFIEKRAVVEGPYVELREVVLTPQNPRGFRFLGGVCVPFLLALVAELKEVPRVISAYVRAFGSCSPEQVAQVLARLYQDGVLEAGEG